MPKDAVTTNTVKSFKFSFSRTISWYFWDMANQHDYSRKERKRVGKKKGKRYRRAENGKKMHTHAHTKNHKPLYSSNLYIFWCFPLSVLGFFFVCFYLGTHLGNITQILLKRGFKIFRYAIFKIMPYFKK